MTAGFRGLFCTIKKMKRVIKGITILLIIAAVFQLSVIPGSSGVFKYKIFSGKNGVYLTNCSGKNAAVIELAPENRSYSFSFDNQAVDCCVLNKTAYFLVYNHSRDKCADIFTASSGKLKKSLTLQNIIISSSSAIAVDNNGNIYIKNSSAYIQVFNKSGRQINELREKSDALIQYPDFAAAYRSKHLYKLYGDKVKTFDTSAEYPLYGINGNYIADINGTVYNAGNMSKKADFNTEGFYKVAATDNYFVTAGESSLSVYNKAGTKINTLDFDTQIQAICSYKNSVCAVLRSGGNYLCEQINEANLKPKAEPAAEKGADGITPGNYRVRKGYIFVDVKTTIGDFKESLAGRNYDIVFKNRRTGYIRTSNEVTISSNGVSKTYTFIVIGDVTGEGNVNSRDERAMFNHLLGKETLSGINRLAGDINRDNKISNCDLVLLSRLE